MKDRAERAEWPAIAPTPAPLPVFEYRGQLVADSRDVAALIGRPHFIVLRTIRAMYKHLGDNNFVCSDYFIEAAYISEQGKEQPCFYCTQMGCDMVANKMTGERGDGVHGPIRPGIPLNA